MYINLKIDISKLLDFLSCKTQRILKEHREIAGPIFLHNETAFIVIDTELEVTVFFVFISFYFYLNLRYRDILQISHS